METELTGKMLFAFRLQHKYFQEILQYVILIQRAVCFTTDLD